MRRQACLTHEETQTEPFDHVHRSSFIFGTYTRPLPLGPGIYKGHTEATAAMEVAGLVIGIAGLAAVFETRCEIWLRVTKASQCGESVAMH